jgi:aspartate aminotransferase-like enzyme
MSVNHTLFTVGPVEVRKEVLEAMTKPMITHRSKAFEQLQEGIVEKLHKALDTDMNILMSPASASGLLEACVRSGVNRNMVGISNGSFGDRWQGIGTENGKEVRKVNAPWGKAVRPSHLEGAIDDSTEAVTLVSNESSTGVLNPVAEIVKGIREKHDPLIFVDGVTAVFGTDLRIKELDLDALVFGTQKALALPPGLAIMCCSDRLLEKAKTVPNRGYYFDLVQMKKMADKNYSLTTPPVSLMYALDFQLERMLKEGMAARYERHKEMAEMVRKWAMAHHGLFAEPGYLSDTITVINRGDIDFNKLNKGLKERGCEISNGYGNIKETTFRVGHMGDLTPAEVRGLLKNMDEVLEAMR